MKPKNFFVFNSFSLMFPLMMFFLAACGDKAADKPIAAQQNYGMPGLVGPNELYCPEGYNYDAKYHQCFGQSGVLGPFSNSMVNKCKSFGGEPPARGCIGSVNSLKSSEGKNSVLLAQGGKLSCRFVLMVKMFLAPFSRLSTTHV